MSRLPEHLQPHFHEPRHVGPPEGGYDLRGEARHPVCGDHLVVYLAVRDGLVAEAGFKAMGCPASMAIAAAATELLHGLPADGLSAALGARYTDLHGDLPAAHGHALRLVERAVDAAV